ncbi:extracellular solute-binding protein [Paenibacillus sp. MWE-103]|uniref:Extracellular solute-binding protein n=1 Tax=Paenibacillus artemisiicola TaxID=1172618 RepID=A0ABS3W983_9BACL|nr:extracellular solute-binding protein [Paenibacillus artemisiicola]MBO7744872.1 extracellular solute-binding protein [Paenibacillus artemisiicola]
MNKYGLGLAAGCLLAAALAGCDAGGGTGGNAVPWSNAPGANGGASGGEGGGAAAETGGASAGTGKTTIVFSAFWHDPKYQAAKKAYEALHPDVEIKLEDVDYTNETLEGDIEKYVTATNAALLAGKGPDLIEMDLLPADSYVKHGLLADLSPMMAQDKDFKRSDYFTNVLDNVRVGDALYAMPLSFFLMGFAGDEGAIAKTGVAFDDLSWSWSDFAKTAEAMTASGGQRTALSYEGPEYLLGEMVSDNYGLFLDPGGREAHFDSASFTGLMKQVKTMFDDGVVSAIGRGVNAYFNSIQINSPKDYLESMAGFSLGAKMADKTAGDRAKLYAKPHAQDTAAGGYFKTYRSVAIAAGSKVQAAAWDFVKFMMSEEMQAPATTTGFPINKAAYAEQAAALKKEGSFRAVPEGPLQGAAIQVDEAMLDGLGAYVEGAVHPSRDSKSDQVWNLVVAESKAFFAGQKSAEAVASLIQNKAMTFLNE